MCVDKDLWVVTFDDDEELFLLKKQIESLILWNYKLDYNIIINDSNHDKVVEKMRLCGILELIDAAKKNFNTTIYERKDFISDKEAKDNGYISQQFLKLQVYKKSTKEQHIILDCKNIILDPNILYNLEPKVLLDAPQVFIGCYDYFTRIWHRGKHKPVRSPSTPFIFEKNILKKLEDFFVSRKNYIDIIHKSYPIKSLRAAKLAKKQRANKHRPSPHFSEFTVYSLFEQHIKEQSAISNTTDNNILILFQTSKKIDKSKDYSKYNILNIHRKSVSTLGQKKSEQLINYFLYKC